MASSLFLNAAIFTCSPSLRWAPRIAFQQQPALSVPSLLRRPGISEYSPGLLPGFRHQAIWAYMVPTIREKGGAYSALCRTSFHNTISCLVNKLYTLSPDILADLHDLSGYLVKFSPKMLSSFLVPMRSLPQPVIRQYPCRSDLQQNGSWFQDLPLVCRRWFRSCILYPSSLIEMSLTLPYYYVSLVNLSILVLAHALSGRLVKNQTGISEPDRDE